ncbi:hypothetical protein [Sutterella sp.]|uniref:hypothetical protein n=1 Tax=Sutterella sp. TaxID=1981025 RepID=UPI0026E02650|nr:hypothetical protein [Sutterella sp.]MDO5531736.1 hypothetical protein [Sutterella sp.]
MQQFPNAPEVAPSGPVDLTDQSTVFLVLEELGIAHMQNDWLAANAPGSDDAAAAAEQEKEFFEDLCDMLLGKSAPERVVQNDWAGERLVAHLCKGIPQVLQRDAIDPETADPRQIVVCVLREYEKTLTQLTTALEKRKAAGEEPSAAEYINFMVAWSGFLSGKAPTLSLP